MTYARADFAISRMGKARVETFIAGSNRFFYAVEKLGQLLSSIYSIEWVLVVVTSPPQK